MAKRKREALRAKRRPSEPLTEIQQRRYQLMNVLETSPQWIADAIGERYPQRISHILRDRSRSIGNLEVRVARYLAERAEAFRQAGKYNGPEVTTDYLGWPQPEPETETAVASG